ncbi:RNA polymerase sigma factor [bacterium]|nr:RNA polymerase sigma factor [bacterium]
MTAGTVSVLKLNVQPAEGRFDQLVKEFGLYLRNTIASICPKNLGIQIDDIEQEARIRLWKALEKDVEIRDHASYIYRIAFTTTIDAIRRVKSRKEEQLTTSEDSKEEPKEPGEVVVDLGPSPHQTIETKQILDQVERILATMDENRRSTIKLYLQGMTSFEIAAVLGWSEPKARNLLYRGLKDLRAGLKAAGIDYSS